MLPAARVGDMSATGDVITGPGVPVVLIAGQPAAVVGDLVTGAVFTGAITMGSATVLIGGRPAARVSSMATGANNQTGVPMTTTIIPPGAPTVLIGG
jgi:uncharacterized Zn-binding protein involved in type VI secretion